MKCNSSLTVYHKEFDEDMLEIWRRHNYANVWFYGGQGAGIDKGYENANDVSIRIPYGQNADLDFGDFSIGDIVVNGTLDFDIATQQDLDGYELYNIKTKQNNTYGREPHIHLGGK